MEWKEFILEEISNELNARKKVDLFIKGDVFSYAIVCYGTSINFFELSLSFRSKYNFHKYIQYNFENFDILATTGTTTDNKYYIRIKNLREFVKETNISVDKFNIENVIHTTNEMAKVMENFPLEFI